MALLQDVIHQLEEGAGVRWIRRILLCLVLCALFFAYNLREYRNFESPKAMDLAQVARNLAEGHGFSTRFIRPISLYLVQTRQTHSIGNPARLEGPHPDLANPPVYPLLLAGLMKVLPFAWDIPSMENKTVVTYQPERLIGFFNQGLFLLAALLLFRLAKTLFDSAVAWLATLVFLGGDLFWRFSLSGLPTMLLVVLFLGITWLMVLIDRAALTPLDEGEVQGKTPSSTRLVVLALLCGLGIGIGGLTHYAFLWLLLPAVAWVLVFCPGRRLLLAFSMMTVVVVVMAPWLWRNDQLSGHGWGIAGFMPRYETERYPEMRLERSLDPDLTAVDMRDYLRKALINGNAILQEEIPQLGGTWFSAFFLVGLLMQFASGRLNRLRGFALISLASLVVVQALTRTYLSDWTPRINSENLVVIVAPLVFMFGAAFYFTILEHLPLPFEGARRLITSLVVLLACQPILFRLLPPRSPGPIAYPPYIPSLIQKVGYYFERDELIMSDVPWAVAWYSGRPSLWLTLNVDPDFYRVHDTLKPIKAIYLTPMTTDAKFNAQLYKGKDWAWGRFYMDVLLRHNLPKGFPIQFAKSGYLPDQLFLADRRRWLDLPSSLSR